MADEGFCNPLNEELLSDNDSSVSVSQNYIIITLIDTMQ